MIRNMVEPSMRGRIKSMAKIKISRLRNLALKKNWLKG